MDKETKEYSYGKGMKKNAKSLGKSGTKHDKDPTSAASSQRGRHQNSGGAKEGAGASSSGIDTGAGAGAGKQPRDNGKNIVSVLDKGVNSITEARRFLSSISGYERLEDLLFDFTEPEDRLRAIRRVFSFASEDAKVFNDAVSAR
jgi:hypothetical protein